MAIYVIGYRSDICISSERRKAVFLGSRSTREKGNLDNVLKGNKVNESKTISPKKGNSLTKLLKSETDFCVVYRHSRQSRLRDYNNTKANISFRLVSILLSRSWYPQGMDKVLNLN